MSILVTGAYVVAFPPTFSMLGDVAGAFAVVPVAVIAALFGLGAGVVAAIASFGINLLLIGLVGAEPSSVAAIGAAAVLILALAVLVGRYHDVVAQLKDVEREHEHALWLLKTREADLEHIVTSMPVVVFRVDRRQRFQMVMGGGLEPLGVEPDDLVDTSIDEFFDIDHPGHPVLVAIEDALEYGEVARFDAKWSGRGYTVKVEPIRDADGVLVAALGIAIDVSAQYRQQAELRRLLEGQQEATDRLASLNDMKDGFLQAISHELRTPLTTIRGFATTLRRHRETMPADAANVLYDRLLANVDRLDRLLNDLLDVDRLGRGVVEPRRTPVEVGRMACEIADNLQLGSRPLTLQVQDVTAWVDGPKVERIIESLLSNAVKHTPEGTKLTLTVRATDAGVYMEVSQEGVAVPDKLKEEIFEPFRQGPLLTDHQPGTGIGLSLVKRFAELHGGRVWVEDTDDGGAAFCVEIQADEVGAAQAPQPPADPATELEVVSDETVETAGSERASDRADDASGSSEQAAI